MVAHNALHKHSLWYLADILNCLKEVDFYNVMPHLSEIQCPVSVNSPVD